MTKFINDDGKTILDIVLENASKKIWSFCRTSPSADAPITEDWTYTYLIIPIGADGNTFMVIAYRYSTADIAYQRIIISKQWFDNWFKFQGIRQ